MRQPSVQNDTHLEQHLSADMCIYAYTYNLVDRENSEAVKRHRDGPLNRSFPAYGPLVSESGFQGLKSPHPKSSHHIGRSLVNHKAGHQAHRCLSTLIRADID